MLVAPRKVKLGKWILVAGHLRFWGVSSFQWHFLFSHGGKSCRRFLVYSSRTSLILGCLGFILRIFLACVMQFWRQWVLCRLSSIAIVWPWRGCSWCIGLLGNNNLKVGLALRSWWKWILMLPGGVYGSWCDGFSECGTSLYEVQGIAFHHFDPIALLCTEKRVGWACCSTSPRNVLCGTEVFTQP